MSVTDNQDQPSADDQPTSGGLDREFKPAEVRDLIARCRRGESQRDWQVLRQLIERDIQTSASKLDIRWLLSVADTYADYGEQHERLMAHTLAMLVNMVKLADAMLFGAFRHPDVICDGITGFDALDNTLANQMERLERDFRYPASRGADFLRLALGEALRRLLTQKSPLWELQQMPCGGGPLHRDQREMDEMWGKVLERVHRIR